LQIHTLISLLLAIAICGVAIWRGDYAARRIGAAQLACWLGSLLVYRRDAYNADIGMLAIDILTLFYFAWVSMRSRRIWTVVVSAFQAIIVASHIATIIDLRVTMGTFFMSMAVWSYGNLLCIAFGTWAGWRERRRQAY
jgi:hypothetical protein